MKDSTRHIHMPDGECFRLRRNFWEEYDGLYVGPSFNYGPLPSHQLLCKGCNLFMGLEFCDIMGEEHDESLDTLQNSAFVVKKYARICKKMEPIGNFVPCRTISDIVCKCCGQKITQGDQLLSPRHCWDCGDGIEGAGYYNALNVDRFLFCNTYPLNIFSF
jgi:hypothetical protein